MAYVVRRNSLRLCRKPVAHLEVFILPAKEEFFKSNIASMNTASFLIAFPNVLSGDPPTGQAVLYECINP